MFAGSTQFVRSNVCSLLEPRVILRFKRDSAASWFEEKKHDDYDDDYDDDDGDDHVSEN